MATVTITKGLIGVEDVSFMTGGATTGETFNRATSTGGTQVMHKLSAKAVPIEDTGTKFTATNVETALIELHDDHFAKVAAYMSAGQAAVKDAWTLIVMDTEYVDASAEFAVGTSKFTSTAGGWYLVSFNVEIALLTTETASVGLVLDGTTVIRQAAGHCSNSAYTTIISGTFIVQLTAAQTLELQILCRSAANRTITGGVYHSDFNIYQVSQ